MKCQEIDYKIYGDDLQFVEVELDPNETVVAEAGAMMYMEENVEFEAKMGDGSAANEDLMSKIFSAGKRMLTGESIFMTHFTNRGQGKKHVAFSAYAPGKIIPVDMSKIHGNTLLCQKDSFLCSAMGTQLSIAFTKRFGAGFFGGEGFILQKLIGDGMVFLNAGGYVHEIQLQNEKLKVDTGCIVGFEQSVSYDIERAGNLKSMFLGGEGLFLATLQGPGKVWLQSLPFSRLADRILANAPRAGGKSTGEGSVLGGLATSFLQD
ncbi:MAG: TIGR00266 family protein [Candidatus Lindowbacteria bacterium]|nr:TIGR00266 family protein [Candidatus Lindowbacteria bacterium]